jgi:hypothetical protein
MDNRKNIENRRQEGVTYDFEEILFNAVAPVCEIKVRSYTLFFACCFSLKRKHVTVSTAFCY